MRVGLWSIGEDGTPHRLEQRRNFGEVDLEDWINTHPGLVLDGLEWVGRQVVLPGRPRVDLIGVTREGQLVIAELKRGTVDVATLTQALFYALSIVAMDAEAFLGRLPDLSDEQRELLLAGLQSEGELDMMLLLVGTARSPELDRASEFLSERGLDLPVRVTTFVPFADKSGNVLLAREIAEHEQQEDDVSPRRRTSRGANVEWVQQRARELGVGDVIDEAIALASELGLKVRPWPKSLTIAPGTGMLKTLLYLGVKEPGMVGVGYSEENLAALYGADEEMLSERLGENWRDLDPQHAREGLHAFGDLMRQLLQTETEPVTTQPREDEDSA